MRHFFFVCPFALNMILYKFAGASNVRSIDIVSGAFLIAGGVYLFPALRRSPGMFSKRALTAAACIVVFGGTIGFSCFSEGVGRSGAARGGLFLMTTPVWTAIFEAILGHKFERAVIRRGLIVVLGGLLLASPGLASGESSGDLFLLATVTSFAVGNVAAKYAMREADFVWLALIRAVGSGLLLLLIGARPLDAGAWGIASGLLSSSFLMAIFLLIRKYGAAQGALANIYASCLAAFIGVTFLSEPLAPLQWLGGAIIVAASLNKRGTVY